MDKSDRFAEDNKIDISGHFGESGIEWRIGKQKNGETSRN